MVRELAPEDTHLAYLAMRELRPNVGAQAEFTRTINDLERPEGYRLVAAFAEGEPQAAAAAGFRTGHFLAWGYVLYCDDLSTRPEFRRQGHSGALMDWMIAEARRLGCAQFHLDSGVSPNRHEAHRLYMNKRMGVTALHFLLEL